VTDEKLRNVEKKEKREMVTGDGLVEVWLTRIIV
jgi:hypothetical protein